MPFGTNPKIRINRGAKFNVRQGAAFAFNNCLALDGVNDYVNTVNFTGLTFSAFTISLWFKLNITSTNTIFSSDLFANAGHYIIITNATNQIDLFIKNTGGTQTINSLGGTVLSANWYHLAFTFDQPTFVAQVFLNGTRIINATGTGTANNTFTFYNMGQGTAISNNYNGLIDEHLLYNRVLSNTEITNLYNNGQGTANYPKNGLLARYAFDETTGTTTTDASGNNNTMTLVNGVLFSGHT